MRITPPLPMFCTAVLILALLISSAGCQTGEEKPIIQNDSLVTIEYTLLDEQGNKIESNKGGDPLKYTHGQGEIMPGLENRLEGMQVGEQKTIRLKPKNAFGPILRRGPEGRCCPICTRRPGAEHARASPQNQREDGCSGLQPSPGWKDGEFRGQGPDHRACSERIISFFP